MSEESQIQVTYGYTTIRPEYAFAVHLVGSTKWEKFIGALQTAKYHLINIGLLSLACFCFALSIASLEYAMRHQ